MTNLYIYWL